MGTSKKVISVLGAFVLGLIMTSAVFAQEAGTVQEALQGGMFKGTIGSYMEYVDKDAIDSNTGWGNAYVEFKYETLKWNDLQAGIAFLGHGDIYNESDTNADPFNGDIEKEFTMPELYLTYNFLEKSKVTVGRYDHRKISHIDDSHSEGAYAMYNEIENVGLTLGYMRRFAELDYDDGEDFGRTNDSQDLSSEDAFGADSKSYLLFLEGKMKAMDNMLMFNPYAMYQDGYASVLGLDTKLSLEADDIKYGAKLDFYHVDADVANMSSANAYMIAPFVKIGPVSAEVGYADFDNDDDAGQSAFNRPTWLADYFLPLDQIVGYGLEDSSVYFAKIKYTLGKFWTHVAYGKYEQEMNAATGDGIDELELQFGYKVTDNLALNLRLFDVAFDNVDNKNYKKVETHVTYKF